MRNTPLFHAVLISLVSLTTVGCFDSDSDVAAATLNANAAMDKSIPSINDNADGSTTVGADDVDSTPRNVNIPKEQTSSPESKSAYAEFVANPVVTKAPVGIPEKGGVSHKPMNSGSIVLKKPTIAPSNSPTYGADNTVECVTSPASFYCSDQYLLQVQQSKNRVILKNGSEVVLTPAFDNPTTFMLTYIGSNKQAQPSGYVVQDFGENSEFPVKYARLNGEACFYGTFYSSGVIDSLVYNCYKPGEDVTDLGLMIPLVSGSQTFDSTLTSVDLELLPQSNYDSFVSIVP